MAPFKFGKKKHDAPSPSAKKNAPNQGASAAVAGAGTGSASPQPSTASKTTINTTGSSTHLQPSAIPGNNAMQQQSPAALGYDHNNNIYNPRSPQRTAASTQGPGTLNQSSQFGYASPQRQPQFAPPPPQQQIQFPSPWSRTKLLISPFPRYRHTASTQANEKGEIFVMGGLHNTSVYGDTWIIKQDEKGAFQTFQVDIYENSPAPRVGHASTLCGNAYVIFGGDTVTNDAGEIDNDLYLFNMNSHTWTIPCPIGQKPPGRYGHSIGVIAVTSFDSKLYLYGGQLDDVIYKDLAVFNLSSFRRPDVQWEIVTTHDRLQPPPLTNHTLDVYDHKLWIFGGSTGKRLSNELWSFDPIINGWEKVITAGATPPPLEEHASVIYNDLLVIHGGKTISGEASSACYFLNLVTKVWFKLPSGLKFESQGKYGHSISVLQNDRLLILGGHLPDYANLGDDLEPSTEDNGVGTILNILDLSNISKIIPGLYQYGTPTRSNDQERFVNHQPPVQNDNTQHSIFTPVTQTQSSPIRERTPSSQDQNRSIGLNSQQQRNISGNSANPKGRTWSNSSSSSLKKLSHPKGISAEDVFQHQYSNTSSPKDQTFVKTPQINAYEQNELNQTPTQLNRSNIYSSPEEELPLEIPPPLETPSKEPQAHDHLNERINEPQFPVDKISESITSSKSLDLAKPSAQNGLSDETSYITSDTRVSEFFDDYVNSESQVNLTDDERKPLNASGNLEKSFEIKNLSDEGSNLESAETSNIQEPVESNITKKTLGLGAVGLAGVGAAAGSFASKAFGDSDNNKGDNGFKQSANQFTEPTFRNIPGAFDTSVDDEKEQFKGIIKSLSAELEDLKIQTNEQAKNASEKVRQLEAENKELKSKVPEAEVAENENDTKRKFIKLNTDHQILSKEHDSLKSKLDEIEPVFSSNLIDLQKLNDIIKSQELIISETEKKLKEEEDWKFKFNELNLKFENLESKYGELEQRSKGTETEEEPATSDTKQLTSAIDSFLAKYTINEDDDSSDVRSRGLSSNNAGDSELIGSLRSQIDELLKENESSVAEHDALSKEIDELKSKNSELQGLEARLSELSKVEENYKESLHSVKSTSRALQVSQNELAKQKEIVNKLQQDIDELQIFSVRKSSRNATPLVNDFKNQEGDDSQNSQKEDIEDFENEHYNLKVRDLQAELFITKQDNEDLKREILTLKKKLLVVNTPNSSL